MSEFKSKLPSIRVLGSALLLSAGVNAMLIGPSAADDEAPQAQTEPAAIDDAAPAAPAPIETKSKQKKDSAAEAKLPKAGKDYYTERAKQAVGAEANIKGRQNPIQIQHPDQNIVVCEAGCPSGRAGQIMFMEPKSARKPAKSAEMIPTAAGPDASAALAVTCVAGCYDTMPKNYHSLPDAANNVAALKGLTPSPSAQTNNWVTTVARADDAPLNKPKAASGDWMKRIEQPTGSEATAPAAEAVAKSEAPATTPAPVASAQVAAAPPAAKPEPAVAEVAKADIAKTELPTPVKPEIAQSPAKSETAEAAAKPEMAEAPAKPEIADEASVTTPSAVAADAVPAAVAAEAPASQSTVATEAAPAIDTPAAPEIAANDSTSADTAVNTDAMNEGSDLKQAGDMASALDKAKATAEKAEAISSTQPPVTVDVSSAVAPPAEPTDKPAAVAAAPDVPAMSSPESPKIVSGPAPEAVVDEPMQVAAATPVEEPEAAATNRTDAVINVESGDTDMNAAISKARQSLPEFWSKLDAPAPGESDFSLKVAIEGAKPAEVEHFWLTDIVRKDGKIVGVISNDPETVKSVKRGQSYDINPEKISDWLYKRNGKMVGNETMRPLLKRLPAQQAAAYRSMYETP